MISALLNHKAPINIKNKKGETPLDCARSNNHPDAVKMLQASGGSAAAASLLAAVRAGSLEETKKLIAAGANLNEKSGEDGISPLIAAAYRGHLNIVQALVNAGAKVNILNTVTNLSLARFRFQK